jgi:hypothetical protein
MTHILKKQKRPHLQGSRLLLLNERVRDKWADAEEKKEKPGIVSSRSVE